MNTAVCETKEIYKYEVGDELTMRWLLAHARRFLERATSQGYEMELLVGTCPYVPRNLEELEEAFRQILTQTRPLFNEGRKIICRVSYRISS